MKKIKVRIITKTTNCVQDTNSLHLLQVAKSVQIYSEFFFFENLIKFTM